MDSFKNTRLPQVLRPRASLMVSSEIFNIKKTLYNNIVIYDKTQTRGCGDT
jgi:hypothetical protein